MWLFPDRCYVQRNRGRMKSWEAYAWAWNRRLHRLKGMIQKQKWMKYCTCDFLFEVNIFAGCLHLAIDRHHKYFRIFVIDSKPNCSKIDIQIFNGWLSQIYASVDWEWGKDIDLDSNGSVLTTRVVYRLPQQLHKLLTRFPRTATQFIESVFVK